jgi:arylsulfatase B
LAGGRKVDAVMGYVDVLPTLRRIVGVREKPKHPLDGVDVLDVLLGRKAAPDRAFYLGDGALVTQEWKLVKNQLFRIDRDPGETTDVAQQHPKVVARLQEQMKAFRAIESRERLPGWGVGRKGFVAPKDWRIPDDDR